MPRAAVLSIHARVEGTEPSAWDDPSLVQLWGPRFSVFVVAACDLAVFSLGTMPDDAKGRQRAEKLAADLAAALGDERIGYGEAGRRLGVNPNRLRYAAATGTVLIRWEGARQPTVWTVPAPAMSHARGAPRARAPPPAQLRTGHAGGLRALGRDRRPGCPGGVRGAGRVAGTSPYAGRRGVDPRRGRGPSSAPSPAQPQPRGCSPAATRFSCSREPTGSSWSPTRVAGASSGRRGSGRARCWSTARSPGRGGGRARC